MSLRFAAVALLFVTACEPATPGPAKDPTSPDDPFPSTDPNATRRPPSGRCYSDIDCRANGMECLQEGKGKPGTCVRMDPAVGPNGLPSGPCMGGPCPH
jgi:hypothetical protein